MVQGQSLDLTCPAVAAEVAACVCQLALRWSANWSGVSKLASVLI